MNILIPLLTLKNNGGNSVAMSLAKELSKNKYNIYIITSSYHGIEMLYQSKNSRINFLIAPSFKFSRSLSMLIFFIYANLFSLKMKPIIINTHLLTYFIKNFNSHNSFWLCQDLEYRFFNSWQNLILKLVFKKIARNSNIVTSSEWLRNFFQKYYKNKLIYGSDIGISKLFADDIKSTKMHKTYNFFMIAKNGLHKRPIDTIYIAEKLSLMGYKVFLINQSKFIAKRNKNLTLSDALNSPAIKEIFLKSSVFISLSKAEGYGLMPLEALALNCSVVTTRIPSINKISSSKLFIIEKSNFNYKYIISAAIKTYMKKKSTKIFDSFETTFVEDWSRDASNAICKEIKCQYE